MEAKIISSVNGLDKLKKDWIEINASNEINNPFLSWEWNNRWIKSYADHKFMRIVVIYDSKNIAAIAPFSLKNKKITFLSDPFFADYTDVVLKKNSDEIIDKVIKTISQFNSWNILDLSTLPETSRTASSILRACQKYIPYSKIHCLHINPFIHINGKFSDFFKSRKKSLRSEMVRTRNILNNDYSKWEFIIADKTEDKLEIFDALVDFHLNRQSEKVGTSIFDHVENIKFFKDLIISKDLEWKIELSAIKVDNSIVSSSISIIDKGIHYYWIPSFKKSFPKGSIGNFHLMQLIEECFNSGIKRFDFMGGDEAYKLKWANDSYENYRIIAFRSLFFKFKHDLTLALFENLKKYKNNRFLKPIWIKISKNL